MASDLPNTFKAAVFEKPGAPLTIKDVPLELPKQGEVLIKVLACGVCHSDAAVQDGAMGNPFPMIPGHEMIGNVAAIGPRESKWKVGDRVGGAWHGGQDNTCKQCRRGLFQTCDNKTVNGVYRNGGYAEYCLLRTEAVVRVPREVEPAEYGPFLCAGVTVFNGIRKMNITPGDTVAIQGLGGLGHLALQYSRKMGYRTVALSRDASKEDFARELGANDYIDGSKGDTAEQLKSIGGADLIVVTAPNPQIVPPLINGINPGGKLLILAPIGDVSVNTLPMILNGVSVHGWPSGHALDSEEAIAFAQRQEVKCMVERFPLKDAQKAFDHMLSGKVRFRAVLTMA